MKNSVIQNLTIFKKIKFKYDNVQKIVRNFYKIFLSIPFSKFLINK